MEGIKQDLIDLVGRDHVVDDPVVLEAYSRDESFVFALKPRFVVRPGSEGEEFRRPPFPWRHGS